MYVSYTLGQGSEFEPVSLTLFLFYFLKASLNDLGSDPLSHPIFFSFKAYSLSVRTLKSRDPP